MVFRVTLNRVLVLCLLTMSFTWLFHFLKQDDSPKKNVHIIILSSWRSGSSFLGQIFNHHPDVFYLFEPPRMVWVKLPNERADYLHYPIRDLIHSLFNCDVSPLHYYLPRNGRYISDLPYFSESRALCFPPACKKMKHYDTYDRPTCFQRCGYVPLEMMAEACKIHSHVVLKTVRILDIRFLLPLLRDPNLDLRIIHLVRDPRGVAFSRKNFNLLKEEDLIVTRRGGKEKGEKHRKPNVTQVMFNICKAQADIFEAAQLAGPLLQGRYMVIRHEDIAIDTLASVDKVYKFAGLGMTPAIETWLLKITNQKNKEQRSFMSFVGESQRIIQKWRMNLNHKTVLEVQDACKEAMDVFGYQPIKSLKEQKDLKLDLLRKEIKSRG
ncbi:carbohydrate sulfotransferase 4-like [Spea bombifrons]|uniref:carbohydrate sulfotransferase 4-like n=1 Tax=Spea bombifrons TaxID=233779 RepID=UPI00234BB01D|nr:carbohydrate sulfotransferase 4-like [Spea bombifrons]